jgi:hypothetical protein
VKYRNNRGVESGASEFTPTASEFEPLGKVPKINLPKIPKVKLPGMPGLPERERQELENIQRRLEKKSPGTGDQNRVGSPANLERPGQP